MHPTSSMSPTPPRPGRDPEPYADRTLNTVIMVIAALFALAMVIAPDALRLPGAVTVLIAGVWGCRWGRDRNRTWYTAGWRDGQQAGHRQAWAEVTTTCQALGIDDRPPPVPAAAPGSGSPETEAALR